MQGNRKKTIPLPVVQQKEERNLTKSEECDILFIIRKERQRILFL